MLQLTNPQAQTLQPGEAATFPVVAFGCECINGLRIKRPGTYRIHFDGNIGAVAPGAANLAIALGGVVQPTSTMIVTTAAAGDLASVSREAPARIGCCQLGSNQNTVSVVNTGATALTIGANASIIIEGEHHG